MSRSRKPTTPPGVPASAPAGDHPALVPLHGGQKVGGWADPDANTGRHYSPTDLGHTCPVCRNRIPLAIDQEHTHPCCGIDDKQLLARSRAALRARIGSPRRRNSP